MSLLSHQIPPDPLNLWVIFGSIQSGKTHAVLELFKTHPDRKTLFVGSLNDFQEVSENLASQRSSVFMNFLKMDDYDETILKIIDKRYELLVFENLKLENYRNFRKIYQLLNIPSVVTTNEEAVLQKILDMRHLKIPADISVAKPRFI